MIRVERGDKIFCDMLWVRAGGDGYKGGIYVRMILRYVSSVILHMLNRVHDLVDKFHRDPRNYAFSVSESTLESTESDPGFLSGYPREELNRHDRVQ